jgi:putative glutamine amidotransferase
MTGSLSRFSGFVRSEPYARKPLVGVLCCNEFADRPVQTVASRFVKPLTEISGATVLLVPAISEACDVHIISERLDGLLLTGSQSNVSPHRYGGRTHDLSRLDEQRDEVALALAGHMIEAGRPVFGICRGLQELNVLFGGSLAEMPFGAHHHPRAEELRFDALFDHRHEVELTEGGWLAGGGPARRIVVNSVHEQGIDRLGSGLNAEAFSTDDGTIEAFSARPYGGDVLAVQWHPEWDMAHSAASRRFFALFGEALKGPGLHDYGLGAGSASPAR